MNKQPYVSICVPSFNRAHTIKSAILSVINQTFKDIEIVVVDNASIDNTAEVVASIKDPRLRYLRNKMNIGLPGNANRCFIEAKGEFILLFEDHDLMHPDMVRQLVELLEREPDMAFAATGIRQINEDGMFLRNWVAPLDEVTSSKKFLKRCLSRTTMFFTLTTMIRARKLKSLPIWFDEQHRWYADIDLWLRLASTGSVGYIRNPLLSVRTKEAAHPLHAETWKSLICVDEIHRKSWFLLHSKKGLASLRDLILYETSKIWTVIVYRCVRKLDDHNKWSSKDKEIMRQYLAWPGRIIVNLLGVIPSAFVRYFRDIYHKYHRLRWRFLNHQNF